MVQVIKRNGDVVDFQRDKISVAIQKAMKEVRDEINTYEVRTITDKVINSIGQRKENISVEEIQDIVERALMTSGMKDVAKSYITYRYLHGLARDKYQELMDVVDEKLSAKNVQNQNANVDEKSFGGRVGETADAVMRKYALEYCVSSMAKKNHENNEIYIHDLSSYAVGSHNCLTIPLDDLLANGFNTRQVDIRPAQSVSTAFQLVAVLFQLQSLQQFGGVAASHLDWSMVPYVRKSFWKHFKDGMTYIGGFNANISEMTDNSGRAIEDPTYTECESWYKYALDMTKKEIYQAVEAMYHNLNSLQSRSGNQLPFSSINYGTCTLPEGRMVIKALLDVSIKGVGKLHRTSIFPCGIFQLMKGVNRVPQDPNYDLYRLALRSTAQRLYPNYANCDWSGNAGYNKNDPRTYFATMGKRKLSPFKIF